MRFEARDVPPLLPLWLGAGLGGCVLVVMLCVTLFYPLADSQQDRGPMQHLPPTPRLQVSPAADLAAYDSRKARELRTAPTPIDVGHASDGKAGLGTATVRLLLLSGCSRCCCSPRRRGRASIKAASLALPFASILARSCRWMLRFATSPALPSRWARHSTASRRSSCSSTCAARTFAVLFSAALPPPSPMHT